MPAPSPARGSAPTAPRCSRLQRMLSASETIWRDFLPLMLAMKPTPQESFSRLRSYRPSAGGRQLCSRAGSAGFDAGSADSASLPIFLRAPLRPPLLPPSQSGWGPPVVVGPPWAFAAPPGPPLALREPQFHKFRPGRPTSPTDGLACHFLWLRRPLLRCNPCAGVAPQLRQLCCPNSDHAKFFSITQARKSRRVRGASVAEAGGRLAPDLGRYAAIRPKDRRIQRRGCRRDKEPKRSGRGRVTGAIGP